MCLIHLFSINIFHGNISKVTACFFHKKDERKKTIFSAALVLNYKIF
jgi:hypothetical protein